MLWIVKIFIIVSLSDLNCEYSGYSKQDKNCLIYLKISWQMGQKWGNFAKIALFDPFSEELLVALFGVTTVS